MKFNFNAAISIPWAIIGAFVGATVGAIVWWIVGTIGLVVVGLIAARLLGRFGKPTGLSTGKLIGIVLGMLIIAAITILTFEAIAGEIGKFNGYETMGRNIGRATGMGFFIGAIIGGTQGKVA